MERVSLAGLTTRITGSGDVTCIMLHGFGAPGDDLVPLADELAVDHLRWVFPEAPLSLAGVYGDSRAHASRDQAGGPGPRAHASRDQAGGPGPRAHASRDQAGGPGPRAWWMLDLAKLESDLAAGRPRDRRAEIPEGLAAARDQVSRLVDEVQARFGGRIVLGGFSQGAMLSLDVALHRDAPPAALVLMSGTLLAESEWAPRMAKLAGVPVLQSHGRADQLLPFSIAEILRDQLRAAGAAVDFHAFAGGHEIPRAVLAALQKLLTASAA